MNAQFCVTFFVSVPSWGDQQMAIYLSSPDLRKVNVARRRAVATAKARLIKKLAKTWPGRKDIKVSVIAVDCVG